MPQSGQNRAWSGRGRPHAWQVPARPRVPAAPTSPARPRRRRPPGPPPAPRAPRRRRPRCRSPAGSRRGPRASGRPAAPPPTGRTAGRPRAAGRRRRPVPVVAGEEAQRARPVGAERQRHRVVGTVGGDEAEQGAGGRAVAHRPGHVEQGRPEHGEVVGEAEFGVCEHLGDRLVQPCAVTDALAQDPLHQSEGPVPDGGLAEGGRRPPRRVGHEPAREGEGGGHEVEHGTLDRVLDAGGFDAEPVELGPVAVQQQDHRVVGQDDLPGGVQAQASGQLQRACAEGVRGGQVLHLAARRHVGQRGDLPRGVVLHQLEPCLPQDPGQGGQSDHVVVAREVAQPAGHQGVVPRALRDPHGGLGVHARVAAELVAGGQGEQDAGEFEDRLVGADPIQQRLPPWQGVRRGLLAAPHVEQAAGRPTRGGTRRYLVTGGVEELHERHQHLQGLRGVEAPHEGQPAPQPQAGRLAGVGGQRRGRLQVPGRLLDRAEGLRPPGGLGQVLDRPGPQLGDVRGIRDRLGRPGQVLGDDRGEFARGVRLAGERLDGAQVGGAPVAAGQRAVGHLLHDRLQEPVLPVVPRPTAGLAHHQLGALQAGQHLAQVGVVADQGGQVVPVERLAEHRGGLDHPPLGGAEGVQSGRDEGLQGRRRPDAAEVERVPDQAVAAAHRGDEPPVDQRPDGLDGVQRHPLRAARELVAGDRREAVDQPVEQPAEVAVAERGEVEQHGVRVADQLGVLLDEAGAREQQHEHGHPGRHEVLHERDQALVGVLGVLDQQDHRVGAGPDVAQEGGPRRKQVVAGELPQGSHAEQRPDPGGDPVALVGVRDEAGQRGGQDGRGIAAHLVGTGRQAQPHPERLGQRVEGHPLAVGDAPALVPPGRGRQPVDVLLELPGQARLAHARLAADHHQRRGLLLADPVEHLLDQAQLPLAAHQGRLQPVPALLAARARHQRGRHPQGHGFGLALQVVAAHGVERDRRLGEVAGGGVHPHLARARGPLHARRRVDRVTGDHALPGGPDRDRDLAGDDADPHRQVGDADLLAQPADGRHQFESGADRALGIVLVRDRDAPHGHHGVPDELLDDAAEAVHDAAGGLEVARQQLAHVLVVATLGQGGEPHEVPEEHRGHPPGRHGGRARVGVLRRGRGRALVARRPAGGAEPCAGGQVGAAPAATHLLAGTARGAESRPRRHVRRAPRTGRVHVADGPPPRAWAQCDRFRTPRP